MIVSQAEGVVDTRIAPYGALHVSEAWQKPKSQVTFARAFQESPYSGSNTQLCSPARVFDARPATAITKYDVIAWKEAGRLFFVSKMHHYKTAVTL